MPEPKENPRQGNTNNVESLTGAELDRLQRAVGLAVERERTAWFDRCRGALERMRGMPIRSWTPSQQVALLQARQLGFQRSTPTGLFAVIRALSNVTTVEGTTVSDITQAEAIDLVRSGFFGDTLQEIQKQLDVHALIQNSPTTQAQALKDALNVARPVSTPAGTAPPPPLAPASERLASVQQALKPPSFSKEKADDLIRQGLFGEDLAKELVQKEFNSNPEAVATRVRASSDPRFLDALTVDQLTQIEANLGVTVDASARDSELNYRMSVHSEIVRLHIRDARISAAMDTIDRFRRESGRIRPSGTPEPENKPLNPRQRVALEHALTIASSIGSEGENVGEKMQQIRDTLRHGPRHARNTGNSVDLFTGPEIEMILCEGHFDFDGHSNGIVSTNARIHATRYVNMLLPYRRIWFRGGLGTINDPAMVVKLALDLDVDISNLDTNGAKEKIQQKIDEKMGRIKVK